MRLVVTEESDSVLFLAMEGRLDVGGVEEVGGAFNTIIDATDKHVILDVSGVVFIASLGMSLLVSAAKRLQRRGLGMILVAPQGRVRDVWVMAALQLVLPLADDRDNALFLIQGPEAS